MVLNTRDKLSVVLPVATKRTGRDGNDMMRLTILLRSFLEFFQLADLDRFWIVTPPRDRANARSTVASLTSAEQFQVISELDICPEFERASSRRLLRPFFPPGRRLTRNPLISHGWHRQQLIKLAIADRIRTKHYLVLDSDVICVRPFDATTLLSAGKALCNVETVADYRAIYTDIFANEEITMKNSRVADASRVLGLKRPANYEEVYYGETPVLLCTEGILALQSYLRARYRRPWRETLLEVLPWTEYPLYFQFLEHTGLLAQMHEPSSRNAVLWMDQSLWHLPNRYRSGRSFATWDPQAVFDSEREGGPFVVIQSYLKIPTRLIWTTIAPWIDTRECLWHDRASLSPSRAG